MTANAHGVGVIGGKNEGCVFNGQFLKGIDKAVLVILLRARGGEGQVFVLAQTSAPVQLEIRRTKRAVSQRVADGTFNPSPRGDAHATGAQLNLGAGFGTQVRSKTKVIQLIEPILPDQPGTGAPVHRQPVSRALLAPAQAGLGVTNTVFAASHTGLCTQRIARVACHDIDDPQHGARAIGRGIGTAQHFNALNVLQSHGLQARCHSANEVRRIRRAAIDQQLDAVGIRIKAAVVARQRRNTFKRRAGLKTRHQAQQVRHIAGTRAPDHVAVQNGDGARRLVQPLGQA